MSDPRKPKNISDPRKPDKYSTFLEQGHWPGNTRPQYMYQIQVTGKCQIQGRKPDKYITLLETVLRTMMSRVMVFICVTVSQFLLRLNRRAYCPLCSRSPLAVPITVLTTEDPSKPCITRRIPHFRHPTQIPSTALERKKQLMRLTKREHTRCNNKSTPSWHSSISRTEHLHPTEEAELQPLRHRHQLLWSRLATGSTMLTRSPFASACSL